MAAMTEVVQTVDISTIVELLDTAGLAVLLYLFVKGDVVSKKTVQLITKDLVSEIVSRVIKAFNGIIEDRDTGLEERLDRIEQCIQQEKGRVL